ncbi:hypothetical protein ACFE04_007511 [Oxalis oulophora]
MENFGTARTKAIWLSCFTSAFRTALACTIVGLITIYGPPSIQRQVAFPAFSYVTVILIITDATLGDTLHGCFLALYATVQTVGPAILTLWFVGPEKLTNSTTAVAVAAAAFIVVLPEGTHLKAKRIALGQIVIIYVIGFINGGRTEVVMHPVHVAASTGVGVLACVLALLLPYPRMATCRVKKCCKLLSENASKELKLYVKAFCAEDKTSALSSVSQAKLLSMTRAKLVLSIKLYQESMKWERLPFKFLRHFYMNTGERLGAIEEPLRGIEMAITCSDHTYPIQIISNTELREGLHTLENDIDQTIKRAKNLLPRDSTTVPESNAANVTEFLQTLQNVPTSQKELPSFFFLFCMKLLHRKLSQGNPINDKVRVPKIDSSNDESFWSSWVGTHLSKKRLMPAFKCSLSLFFAVFVGLIYSKENGFWSGLPVAITLAAAREATFKVANVKVQGTVLGTIYGVLGCFLFERYLPIRFLSLVPWFIFCCFLRKSRMYGQAGGISAVIGAVLILGRNNFGVPSEFAIARITETIIGLSCSLVVELVLQPTRASTMSKVQLSKTLTVLHDTIGSLNLQVSEYSIQSHKKLKVEVNQLGKLVEEAEAEPNFWFLPFHSNSYKKLAKSLSNIADLLQFSDSAMQMMLEQKMGAIGKELEGDLNLFKETICTLVKSLKEVTMLKSLAILDKEVQLNNISTGDVELGKFPKLNIFKVNGDDDQMEKILNSYLQHSKETVDKIGHGQSVEEEKKVKSQMVLSLGALGYCLKNMINETREIEEGIKELLQWENPTSHISLHEISSKIHALIV